ncbi:MAG: ABC transporter permease, partial [Candidatus Undinarchaeales archaeon]|nr:ABC transporter permease [Candidatus Undinarchaeales archaeon]
MRNKTLTVALFEFTRTAMRKGFLVSAFVVPLLMILLMLVSMYLIQDETPGLGHNENIGFVDRSDLFGPRDGFAEFAGTGPAREALMRDELSLLFVIHEDYLATGNITIYSMNSSLLNGRSKGAIRSFIMKGLLKQGNVGEELSERIEAPMSAEMIELDELGEVKEDDENMFVLALLLYWLMMMGIINSSGDLRRGILEEKERRTGEILLSSISAEQLLSGKILGYGCTGLLHLLLQTLVWTLVGLVAMSMTDLGGFLAGLEYSWLIGLAIVYFLLGYFLFATSIACAAAVSPSVQEAEHTSSIFT